MKQDNRKAVVIFCGLGILPVIWLGLLMAPAMKGGLPAILLRFPDHGIPFINNKNDFRPRLLNKCQQAFI